jgi:hypothetical protein
MSTPPRAADRSGMSVPSPAVTRHRSFAPGGRPLAANSWHANDCGIACGETSTAGTAALQLFLLGFQFFLTRPSNLKQVNNVGPNITMSG